jgi:hypothetical protein
MQVPDQVRLPDIAEADFHLHEILMSLCCGSITEECLSQRRQSMA